RQPKSVHKITLQNVTCQRSLGIIEARMHASKDVTIAKLASVNVCDRQALQAAAQGAPSLPQPNAPVTQEQKTKALADNVAKVSEENPALDVQATDVSGGTKFVFTVINTSEKL